MSQENVEIVGRLLSDDLPALYRMIGTLGDFVWDMTTFEGWPDQGEFRGFAAFVGFLRRWVEPYAEWRIEIEDIRDPGGERVVAVLRQEGRLHDSESWIEMRYGIVYTLNEGTVRRASVYATPEQALEAAGLRA